MVGDRAAPSRRVLANPSLMGLLVAAFAWWASLYPTLIPRDWLMGGVVSGASAAVGYGIGSLIARGLRRRGPAPDVLRRYGRIGLLVVWAVVLVAGGLAWLAWENDLRDLVYMPRLGPPAAVLMAVAGLAIAAMFVLLARVIGRGIGALHRRVGRVLPGWLAEPATLALIGLVIVVVGHGVIWPWTDAGSERHLRAG